MRAGLSGSSRDDLLQRLRGIGFDGLDRSIDARISRLRKKLGHGIVETARGLGYRLGPGT
jgi:two-component system OmpR family response regulator/two-component system response regulator RstA